MTNFYDDEDYRMYDYHKRELKRYLFAQVRANDIFFDDPAVNKICLDTCEFEINYHRSSMVYIKERCETGIATIR